MLDLNQLNEHFITEVPFNGELICSDCNKQRCSCCGNDIDCGRDPETCSKIMKAQEAHITIKKENFQYKHYKGMETAVSSSRIIGVLDGEYSVHQLSKIYGPYKEISNIFLNIDRLREFYFLPNGRKENYWNPIHKGITDLALKLCLNARFFYCYNQNLIIQNKDITILIGVRSVEEDEF